VSGGVDSMVLLAAAVKVAPEKVYAVATFDHASGRAARAAVQLVRETGERLRVVVAVARAAEGRLDEARLRALRWKFLDDIAEPMGARVATAHTLDDQVETVCMRVLRDAGARGLAGMYAPSEIVRPLLGVTRREIAAYAKAKGVRFVEDPSNRSPRYFRNRVRHDLLPAIERVHPGFAGEMIALSRRAASWRASLEAVVDSLQWTRASDGTLSVGIDPLIHLDSTELRTLWPALGARGGVRFDRRGTERLASFTKASGTGATMQLSGGFEVRRERERFVLRRR
jgi:tRNA(Ile)-lysidine synthase